MPDYSCYITITNNTQFTLTHSSDNVVDGHFAVNPPDIVKPGESKNFQLQDNAGFKGSEAYSVYTAKTPTSNIAISLHYSCPVWGSNVFTSTSANTLVIATSNTSSGPSGHPLTATTTVEPTLHESFGLRGFVPAAISDALKANVHDEGAWKDAEEHLTQMKNAERWTVG